MDSSPLVVDRLVPRRSARPSRWRAREGEGLLEPFGQALGRVLVESPQLPVEGGDSVVCAAACVGCRYACWSFARQAGCRHLGRWATTFSRLCQVQRCTGVWSPKTSRTARRSPFVEDDQHALGHLQAAVQKAAQERGAGRGVFDARLHKAQEHSLPRRVIPSAITIVFSANRLPSRTRATKSQRANRRSCSAARWRAVART